MSGQGNTNIGTTGQATGIEDPVAEIERVLQRANLLKAALKSLSENVAQHNPLLPFPALQSRLKRIQEELSQCVKLMSDNADVFEGILIMPTPEFPAQQQSIREQLFSTLLSPAVQEWQDRAVKLSGEREAQEAKERRSGNATSLSAEDRASLWLAASTLAIEAANAQAFPFSRNNDFTVTEIRNGVEHVRRGLKRDLQVFNLDKFLAGEEDSEEDSDDPAGEDADDDEDVDEDEEAGADDSMIIDQPAPQSHTRTPAAAMPSRTPMPVDNVLRYITRGQ